MEKPYKKLANGGKPSLFLVPVRTDRRRTPMIELFEEFNEGGPFMYLILILSIFTLAVIFQKMYFLFFKYRLSEDEVTQAVIKSVESNSFARAIQFCNAKEHPLTNVLKAGLIKANRPEKEIRRAMETAAAAEIPQLKKGTALLPQLSNVATLLGLLGTIRGLIVAFSGMEGGDAVKRQEALSKGIAMAFRATFFALSVAVMMILFYLVLLSKQNKIQAKMEHAAANLVDALAGKSNKNLIGSTQKS
jgi:biopolymer transport protein ExbB